MKKILLVLTASALVAACNTAEDRAEDRMEAEAEARAAAAGTAEVALGASEAQLLEADLYGLAQVELGDVARLLRTDGRVDRVVIEIEDSNPDKFVEVPIAGLRTTMRGAAVDLESDLTMEQLKALPSYDIRQPSTP